MNKKQWMPLIGMTIAAFIFNTSEFITQSKNTRDFSHEMN